MAAKYVGSQINQLVECPICFHRFSQTKKPKILKCSHTVCVECLRQIARRQILMCPVCRGKTNIPKGDVNNIPTNLGILQLAELRPLSSCHACKKESQNTKCFHCEESICQSCLDEHTQDTETQLCQVRDQLKAATENLESFDRNLETKMTEIEDLSRNQIQTIDDQINILILKLQQRRDILIKEVNENLENIREQYETKQFVIRSSISDMTSLITQIQTSLPSLKQTLTKQSIATIISLGPQMIANQKQNMPLSSILVNTQIEALEQEIKRWGAVTSEKTATVKQLLLSQPDKCRAEATFQFTVESISKLKEEVLSPCFYIRNLPWEIKTMPRLTPNGHNSLGFFLQCNGDSKSLSWSCQARAKLQILNNNSDTKPFVRNMRHLFFSKETDWGFGNFISWTELLDPDKGYVKNDTVTLQVNVFADAPHGVS